MLRAERQCDDLLRQAAEVLRQVPAFALHYPRDYSGNLRLRDTVLTHLASLPPAYAHLA